jgi:hypothetical protein
VVVAFMLVVSLLGVRMERSIREIERGSCAWMQIGVASRAMIKNNFPDIRNLHIKFSEGISAVWLILMSRFII